MVQDRISKAIRLFNKTARVNVNKQCSIARRSLKPDIVVIDEKAKEVAILDVTCPFENGPEAFAKAREIKVQKYSPEAEAYRAKGYNVTVDAIVVGALGTWDPSNNTALQAVHIPKRYREKMVRLTIMDVISASTEIYWRHILGDRYVK